MFYKKRSAPSYRPQLRFSASKSFIFDKAHIRTNNHILLKHLGLVSPSKGNKFFGSYIVRKYFPAVGLLLRESKGNRDRSSRRKSL